MNAQRIRQRGAQTRRCHHHQAQRNRNIQQL